MGERIKGKKNKKRMRDKRKRGEMKQKKWKTRGSMKGRGMKRRAKGEKGRGLDDEEEVRDQYAVATTNPNLNISRNHKPQFSLLLHKQYAFYNRK